VNSASVLTSGLNASVPVPPRSPSRPVSISQRTVSGAKPGWRPKLAVPNRSDHPVQMITTDSSGMRPWCSSHARKSATDTA
jgi:hypothetical protein